MVVEYVASLRAAWEVAKAVKVATDAIGDAEIKLQVAELISLLADARIAAAENAERIADLERQLNTKVSFFFDGNKYYRAVEDGESDGPYCPTCYDSESKEIRLKHIGDSAFGNWYCNVCKNHVER